MRRAWLEPFVIAATVMLVVFGLAALHLTSPYATTEEQAAVRETRPAASATERTRDAATGATPVAPPRPAEKQPARGSEPVPAATPVPAARIDARIQAQVATRSRAIANLAAQAEARSKQLQGEAAGPLQLRLAVFNVLGSNHTRPGGSASGYAGGRTRAGWANDVIRDFGLDVVGFSEVQGDQLAVISAGLGGGYDFYPGTSLGNKGIPTNLAWRSDRFAMVDAGSVTIPFVGQSRPMPYVRLKDTGNGREFWVLNAHNAPQGRQSERDAALGIEKSKLRELIATGLPVFFIGDLNEKGSLFCKVTGSLPLDAANGGSSGGGCQPPGGMRVDWIFGSRGTVAFSGYDDNKSRAVTRITDHALVMADAAVQ